MTPVDVPIQGIGKVSLRVRDLAESLAFYAGFLGLRAFRPDPDNTKRCVCRCPEEHSDQDAIMLIEGSSPSDFVPSQNFSLEVPEPGDVDRVFEAAKANSIQATVPRTYEDAYQTFLFDPDGYKVGVMSRNGSWAKSR